MKKILVIDDEAELVDCIRSILETDYRVFTASLGRDGLDLLSREKVSLVVLDYSLPDMNGLEILKEIREGYDIPVIMITAYGNKELVLQSWRHRADYFFDKPFSLKELREKVRELFAERFPFDVLGLDPLRLSSHVQETLEYIAYNLTGPPGTPGKITLRKIAAALKFSPQHLSSSFKKECGRGIYQCIIVLRMERAKELLSRGRDIKEIALEFGYRHPNNFSRLFKNLTGESPSAIRKKTSDSCDI